MTMYTVTRILLFERAFVERGTNKLFVPLIERTCTHSDGTWYRTYSDAHFICGERFLDERFVEVVPSWETLWHFDPVTHQYIEH